MTKPGLFSSCLFFTATVCALAELWAGTEIAFLAWSADATTATAAIAPATALAAELVSVTASMTPDTSCKAEASSGFLTTMTVAEPAEGFKLFLELVLAAASTVTACATFDAPLPLMCFLAPAAEAAA